MPTEFERFQNLTRGYNPVSLQLQQTYYSVENKLDLQGKRNYLNTITEFVNGQNRKKEENAEEIARNEEEIARIKEDTEDELDHREHELTSIEREHRTKYEAIAHSNLSDRQQNRERELARKQLEKARKELEDWKYQNIERPISELNQRNTELLHQNNVIEENTEEISSYINERQRRESFIHSDENQNTHNAIKNSYKNLVKAFESHSSFAKWWGSLWPRSWTDAGRDFDALENAEQILLNSGYNQEEIDSYEREALYEMQPQQVDVEDEFDYIAPGMDIGPDVRVQERKEQENLPFVSEIEEINGDKRDKGFDLNESVAGDLKGLFGDENLPEEAGKLDQVKTNNIRNDIIEQTRNDGGEKHNDKLTNEKIDEEEKAPILTEKGLY